MQRTNGLAGCWKSARGAACLALLAALSLTACDPTGSATDLAKAAQSPAFELARHRVAASGVITLRFTRALDAGSIGARSVTLFSAGEQIRCRLRIADDELRITPQTGRRRAGHDVLTVRLEGAPSPSAIRDQSGEPLPGRVEFEVTVRPGSAADLTPPELVESVPSDGALEVAPGAQIGLRFSEPLDRSAARSDRALRLLVDGAPVAFRQRLSVDRTTLIVRPRSPLPPGAVVNVVLTSFLVDVAGNPVRQDRGVQFHVAVSQLHEIVEDFASSDMADPGLTSCSWCGLSDPGYLVWASGRRVVGPIADEGEVFDLGDRSRVRFQLVVPPDDDLSTEAFASGLRLVFATGDVRSGIGTATVEAGVSELDAAGPSFEGNRAVSILRMVGSVPSHAPLDVRRGEDGLGVAEIHFPEPLAMPAGRSVLLDVELTLAPGVRLAGVPDEAGDALVDGSPGPRLLPIAQLLVTGGAPQARSLWYDSGQDRPEWRRQAVTGPIEHPGIRSQIEFQVAPVGPDGAPDLDLASPWEPELDQLPPCRFVRFRARFEGFPFDGELPRIDRIVMPFESR